MLANWKELLPVKYKLIRWSCQYWLMKVKFEVCMPNQILPKIEKKTFNFKVNKCFPPKFLDPLRLPVWRHIVTGKSLGSLVQISKGCNSHLDERGRGKAKKLANIAKYRLFDRMRVSFGVAIICLCKPFWYFVWMHNFVNLFCGPCCGIAIYFTGPARS